RESRTAKQELPNTARNCRRMSTYFKPATHPIERHCRQGSPCPCKKKGRSAFAERPWRSPPGRREKLLHRRRCGIRGRTRRGSGSLRILARSVRHQANIDAAVCSAAFAGLIVVHRLVLAQSDHINLVGRNVVL